MKRNLGIVSTPNSKENLRIVFTSIDLYKRKLFVNACYGWTLFSIESDMV
jgi:hypothetical protein